MGLITFPEVQGSAVPTSARDAMTCNIPATAAPNEVAVVIATKGRPDIVRQQTLSWIHQTQIPNHVFVISSRPDDIAGVEGDPAWLTAQVGRIGSAFQRNDGLLLAANRYSYIVFFDDDFVPSRFWIERMAGFFRAHPDAACVTGLILVDGIAGEGIPLDVARKIVDQRDTDPSFRGDVVERTHLGGNIGCNMAFRTSAIRDITFDEHLPLYAWLEDADFIARVARQGRIMATDALWGVHLGHKAGRGRGITLGYSQIANPAYLALKGTIPSAHLAKGAARNLIRNAIRSLRPEPYIDRRGRLRGNFLALGDLLRGRVTPERAANL